MALPTAHLQQDYWAISTLAAAEIVREGIKGLEPGVSGEFYRNEYASAYEEAYGERPTTAFGAYGYDAAMLTMLAIAEADEVSADVIRDHLPQVAEQYQGVSGDKTFDDNGMQVDEGYQLVIYQDGELVNYEGRSGRLGHHEPRIQDAGLFQIARSARLASTSPPSAARRRGQASAASAGLGA